VIAAVDLWLADAELGAKAMPPLWQYFAPSARLKPLELICAPKGVGPRAPTAFILQRGMF
jgi:hypothetical protein